MFKEFNEGDIISADVAIKSFSKNKSKNKNDFIKLEVFDGKDVINAFIWDEDIIENFKKRDFASWSVFWFWKRLKDKFIECNKDNFTGIWRKRFALYI